MDKALKYAGIPPGRGRLACVAKMFEVSREASRKWLSGESIPDTKRISDIARLTGVRGEWLLTGQGPMRYGESDTEEESNKAGVHPYILQLAHLIAEAPIDKVQAILLLLGTEGKNATQFITEANRKGNDLLSNVSTTTADRRQSDEDRRKNVREVDFERRSGVDRRDDEGFTFGPGESLDREKGEGRKRRSDDGE